MAPAWDEMAVVGRVARTHGRHGHVIVNPETDFAAERFRPGSVVYVRRGGRVEAFSMTAVRFQQGRPIVGLEGIQSMDAAEALADAELRVPLEALHPLPAGSFYRHDLVGCAVRTTGGRDIGRVKEVEGPFSGGRLVIEHEGAEILVPMASEICVAVDLASRMIVIEPPAGLLELNARPAGEGLGRDRGV